MLAPLNSTMIAVAMPQVMDEFAVGFRSTGWLVTAYLIAMASLQPVAGNIGDRIGRRRLVLGGLVCFGCASLAAAVAPHLWLLIALRTLQAVAAALIVPNGAALIRAVVPEERRGGRFGLIGTAVALAAAVGPPFGSVLITIASWHAVFYVNLVLILPALAIGWRCLPRDGATAGRQVFDVLGAIMLPTMLMVLTGWLIWIARHPTWWALGVGGLVVLMLATVFLRWECRHPDPVLQPRLFRRRAFAAANGGIALGNLAMYTVLLAVPLLLASRTASSTLQTGIIITAMSGAMIVASPLGGWLADRCGRRLPTIAGLALLTLGALPMAVAGAEIMLPPLVLGLVFVGVGIGMAMPGLQSTAVESVREEEAGVASGIYSTSRYLGSIVGSAILAGLLGSDRRNADGLGSVFVIVCAAAAVATVVGMGLRARPEAHGANGCRASSVDGRWGKRRGGAA
jgi:EmrB/QacA subfamily drug resistance transporter